jgi:PIN domain nuclease of toxin-antitoxin system
VSLLIDTHVLIWWVKSSKRISRSVRDTISSEQNRVVVSAISAWEIGIKVDQGKLDFPIEFLNKFDDGILQLGFEPLAITAQHALAGAQLSGAHKDPFDRMLAGQAIAERLTLVSADPQFKLLGIDALW